MKVFSRDTVGRKEIDILRQLPLHPHLVRVIGEDARGSNEDEESVLHHHHQPGDSRNGSLHMLLQPYCPFADLLTFVDAFLHAAPRGEKVMNCIELACITIQLLIALRVLHRNGFGHLDIKPDNILVESLVLVRLSEVRFRYHSSTGLIILGGKTVDASIGTEISEIYGKVMNEIAEDYRENSQDPYLLLPRIVLGDMGAVKRNDISPNELSSGTPQYTAPEIWKKLLRYAPDSFSPIRPSSADMYSLGSTVWTLAAAFCPYDDIMMHKENITKQQRKSAEIRIAENIIHDRNVQCPLPPSQPQVLYHLIIGLMCHNVYNRLTADKALNHPYLEPIYERLENPDELRNERIRAVENHRTIPKAEYLSLRKPNVPYTTVTVPVTDNSNGPSSCLATTISSNSSVPVVPPIMVRRNTTIDCAGTTMDRSDAKECTEDYDTFMDLSPLSNAGTTGTSTLSPAPFAPPAASTSVRTNSPSATGGSVAVTSLSTTSSPKPNRKRNRADHEADDE